MSKQPPLDPSAPPQVMLGAALASLKSLPLSQAADLAATLAQQGVLPLIELFTVAERLGAIQQGEQASALYRTWLEHTVSPIAYAVHFNHGVTLSNLHDDAGAEQAYRAAIALKPDFIEAHLNLGTQLERNGQPEEALTLWRAVLTFGDPHSSADQKLHVQALNNLGRLLEIRKQLQEAEHMLARSLTIDPDQTNAITHWVHLRQKQCEWPVYQPLGTISVETLMTSTSALAMLSASDDPALQLAAARRFVKDKVAPCTISLSSPQGYAHNRLRIGYLSSDFCSHAVSILTAELYELHDRNQVEVFGFCWSRDDGTPMRARVVKGFDHHIRIGEMSDEEAARCIRLHEIDILIDLHGLTSGTRPGIIAFHPAPVQMTYLGFPGSTALPAINYVLADRYVLPPELTPFFTEKPLYLPHTFQINDRQRAIGIKPSRAECGLPEQGFVFCSFNNNFKFTPDIFAAWMRILHRTPGSVLWLVADNEWVRANLHQAAQGHGIAPERVIFAARVAPENYLARYQVADLFLDTLPFNAGTTASDALWAGLPLLTCSGRTFASRMAGSLLHAVNLPELITNHLQEYEDKAVSLAQQPERIAAMKQQLHDNRLTCPLFDTPQLVRDLETIYQQVALRAAPAQEGAANTDSAGAGTAGNTGSMAATARLAINHTPLAPPQKAGNVALFCVTHVPLLVEYPADVKVLHLGSFQADGALNLRDLAPEWDVFHPLLGATAGSFAIRNYLREHPEYDHVAMCSYRKFMTAEQIGEPIRNFPQQHAISLKKIAQHDMRQLLDYTQHQFLISHPLYFPDWGIANIMQQYQQAHHIEDLLRFLAEAVSEQMLEPADVYELLSQNVLIPGGSEFGVYPTYFYLNAIDRLERITAAYLKKYRIIRDGYQVRAISFCCERVGSYLLLKHLRDLHPGGIPASYFGNFNLINS
jgi:predicted O-linked N-acetylglucosamine transferase (SPINDLY family)